MALYKMYYYYYYCYTLFLEFIAHLIQTEVAFDNTGNYCACLLARAMLPSAGTRRKSNRQVKPNMRYASYGMQMLQASRRKRHAELNVEPHSGTAAAEQSGGVEIEDPPEVAVLEPDGGTTAAEQCGAPKTVVVSSERHRGVSVRYGVVVGGSRISVCKKAFMSLHVITQSKVDHLVQQARAQQATARPCLRGKHANRPNRLSEEKVDMVKEHIQSYPAESSHYSRHKNPNRLYLSPFLSISEMYRQYEVWTAARHVVPVSHAAYWNIFCTHFNYGFGTPRSDTCNKCERTQTDASACDIDVHKALAEAAFQQQRKDRRRAITETDVFYITFDMEKTLPLPKLAVSAAFYLRQLWLYNTGVHLISKQKEGPFYNVWTEDQGGRGVQEVASSLLAFLQASGVAGGTLIAWSDSCCGQNKNFLLLCFWQYLLAKKKFDCIEHKFPEPGHSYLDSDRDFGHIELAVKRRQNVYSIDEYCDIMMHSSSRPRPVITRMGDKMCDIPCLPTMLSLRKVTHNMNGEKIELRDRVKWIKMTKLGYYEYKHSFDDNEEWKVVCMLSSDTGPVDVPDLPLQLVSRHAIKKLKVEDIKKQMQYIPIIYQGYYKSVIDGSVQDDAVSCPECSDVDEIDADGSLSHSQVRSYMHFWFKKLRYID